MIPPRADSWWSTRSVRHDWLVAVLPQAYFLGLAFLALSPVLGSGYVLTLDAVASSNSEYVGYLFRSKDPLYYGRLPIAVALDTASIVVPHWVLQKAILIAIVAGSGFSMFRSVRDRVGLIAALYAGTLYAINPFVFVRILAGHWWLLLGYVVIPLAVVAFVDALSGRGRAGRAGVLAAVASAFDPHVAVLLAITFAGVGGVSLVRSDRRLKVIERSGRVGILAAGLSAYWLVPALSTLLAAESKVSVMSPLDLVAFSARGTVDGNVPLSIAMLYGFWRGGFRLPLDWLPHWLALGLFSVVLLGAVVGWCGYRADPFVTGVAIVGVIGFVLGLGVSFEVTAPLFRALSDHVVVFRGMRDSAKFVALLCYAYATLGAYGVEGLVDWIEASVPDSDRWPDVIHRDVDPQWRRAAVTTAILVLVLLVPIAYSWPMLGGFGGQLSTTEYPDSWHTVNDRLTDDPEPGRVLFLPWHQYLDFPWTHGTIVNPADTFFERPVIRGRSIDLIGIESQAASPTHERIDTLLEEPEASSSLGESLAEAGVKYVILSKVATYERYVYLRSEPDLVVVIEEDDIVLFENYAFENAPPPDRWPPAWPQVPWPTFAIGITGSVGTVGVLLSRCHLGRRTTS